MTRNANGKFAPRDALARFIEKCRFDPMTGCVLWTGGPAPIPLEARCKVITRGDGILDGYAIDKGWFHQGWSDDVLAYKLDEPETAQ